MVVIIIAGLYGCNMTATSTKMATPEIHIRGLPSSNIVESVTLKVSGPDMDTLEVNYSNVPSIINLAVPKGDNVTFELTIGLSASFTALPTTTYTSLKGKATTDITSDSAVVTLYMGIGSTKLLAPDYSNNRILQFDNILDTTSESLDTDTQGFSTWLTTNNLAFGANDVEIDNQGRIYISDNGNGNTKGIIRVDNILGTNPILFATGHSNGINTMTIDRKNNIIYYTEGNKIHSSNLDGSNEVLLPETHTDNGALGITVDGEYLYYIAVLGISSILKYSLEQKKVVKGTFVSPYLANPWDVLVKGDKLYITNFDGTNENQILELSTLDLSLTNNYGIYVGGTSSANTGKGNFYGPRIFIGCINEEITIIDESGSHPLDKIIQMDDMNGTNWKTLPNSGNGQNLFNFFINAFS